MEKVAVTNIIRQIRQRKKNGPNGKGSEQPANGQPARLEITPIQWANINKRFRWLKQFVVHIDITPESIAFITFLKYQNKFKPLSCSMLQRDSMDDLEAVHQFLQKQMEAIDCKEPRIWISMQHPALQTVEILIPKISDDIDVETALPLQLKSEVPEYNENDYLWQYIQNGVLEIEGLSYYHFFVVMFPKDLFEQFLKYFDVLHIKPEFILPRPFVFLNGVHEVVHNLQQALVLELGRTTSMLVAYQDGYPIKMLTIPVGEAFFKEKALKPYIPFEDSEILTDSRLKNRLDALLEDIPKNKTQNYAPLIQEVRKLLYWLNKNYQWNGLQTILVNFQTEEDVYLMHALQTVFNVPVLPVIASETDLTSISKSFVLAGLPDYVARHPELIPKNVIWEERLAKANLGMAILFTTVLAAMGGYEATQQATIKALTDEINQLQSTVIQLGEKNETLKNLLIKRSILSKEINYLQKKLSIPEDVLNYLNLVTQNIPQNFALTEIIIDRPENPLFLEYQSLVQGKKWRQGIVLKGYSHLPAIEAESRLLRYIEFLKQKGVFSQIIPVVRNYNVTNRRYEFTVLMVIQ